MSQQPLPEARSKASSSKQGELPDEVTHILVKSLQIGVGAGACGTLFGTTAGIIRSTPTPFLFSFLTGVQWFGLSSVFYGTRQLAIARLGPEHKVTPAQKVGASAIAGAASVVPVGLLLRGPRSILPGALVFSLLGAGGQFAANKWSMAEASSGEKKSSWMDSKWSPVTRLSDEKYESILEEKLLSIEADIAIIDESLVALKAQKVAEEAAKQPSSQGDRS